MLVCTEIVCAEVNDSYTEMGDSEEEIAYREFLAEKNYTKDMGSLNTMMYAVYDVNHDQKKELIVRGFHTEDMHYKYGFYRYKDEKVQLIGMLDNWQNGGNGEMYYVIKGNGIVVNTRLADRMTYTLYQIKDKVEENFTIHRQSVDVKKFGGNYERQYHYSCEDENGDPLGKKIDEEVWSEFEYRLKEIPFYDIDTSEEISHYDISEEEEGSQNQTTEMAEDIEESWSKSRYEPDGDSVDDQISTKSEDASFYGIWCYGSKEVKEANSYAENLKNRGFDAGVFITTNWSNLNTEMFYVVTAGIYATEDEANAALVSVQGVCPDAYVKYSGDFRG